MDWSDVLKDAIGAYSDIETAKASNTQVYRTGQPAYVQRGAAAGGVNPLYLLIGAGVIALVLLRK